LRSIQRQTVPLTVARCEIDVCCGAGTHGQLGVPRHTSQQELVRSWLKGFVSDDPVRGGCPDARVPIQSNADSHNRGSSLQRAQKRSMGNDV
jgi:hypothetical protein